MSGTYLGIGERDSGLIYVYVPVWADNVSDPTLYRLKLEGVYAGLMSGSVQDYPLVRSYDYDGGDIYTGRLAEQCDVTTNNVIDYSHSYVNGDPAGPLQSDCDRLRNCPGWHEYRVAHDYGDVRAI